MINSLKWISLLLFVSLPAVAAQPVQHIVLVWLKDGTAEEVRQEIMDDSRGLLAIEGIQDLQVGKAIPSERPIVDDSFSFGLYMRFATVEDMNAYLIDPKHVEFVETRVKPHLEKLVVYDF